MSVLPHKTTYYLRVVKVLQMMNYSAIRGISFGFGRGEPEGQARELYGDHDVTFSGHARRLPFTTMPPLLHPYLN